MKNAPEVLSEDLNRMDFIDMAVQIGCAHDETGLSLMQLCEEAQNVAKVVDANMNGFITVDEYLKYTP